MKKSNQLIFIDDSGDPGFKTKRGASRLFVIACIIFNDHIDAEFASASLKMLKKQLGWKQEREFKFHRATEEQKSAFFQSLKSLNFHVYATIVDKSLIIKPPIKKSDSFYQEIILRTLHNINEMNNAIIFLDGKTSKNYRNRSVAKIRQSLNKNTRRMIQFRLKDSRNDILIQLADMIAGSIRVKYDPEKSIKTDYLRLIKNKINLLSFYEDKK